MGHCVHWNFLFDICLVFVFCLVLVFCLLLSIWLIVASDTRHKGICPPTDTDDANNCFESAPLQILICIDLRL